MIALVVVTTAVVGVGAYVLVRNSLRGQLVDDAVARAEFNLVVLATPDQLAPDADREAFEASGLPDRFLLRGTGGVYVEFASGEPFASSLTLLGADGVISPELRGIVASGDFGYEFLTLDGEPTLAVAGRRPPAGPDFYFFDSAAEVENALSELARVLAFAGIGLVILAALGVSVADELRLRKAHRAALTEQRLTAAVALIAPWALLALPLPLLAGSVVDLGRLPQPFDPTAPFLAFDPTLLGIPARGDFDVDEFVDQEVMTLGVLQE